MFPLWNYSFKSICSYSLTISSCSLPIPYPPHTHLYSLLPPTCTSFYMHKQLALIREFTCAWVLGYLLDHGILEVIPLKEMIPLSQPSGTIYKQILSKRQGLLSPSHIHTGMWMGSVLYRFYADSHRCFEFVGTTSLSCTKDSL